MKKIFAIALALVMVLSMTSAFAGVGTCGLVDAYTCPTVGCGVAKAEVVKFVADNSADGFAENDCAGVVKNHNVYFGVKVTFDADVNEQWFAHANTKLVVKTSDGNKNAEVTAVDKKLDSIVDGKSASQVSGKTYWYDFDAQKLVSSWNTDCVFKTLVAANTKANVSAYVAYDFDGLDTWIDYGTFKVFVASNTDAIEITVKKGTDTMVVNVVGGEVKYVELDGGVYYMSKGNLLFDKGASVANGVYTAGTGVGTANLTCSDLNALMALINIEFGDCVNKSVVKKIFGWSNDDPVAATWNKDAVAIVDANCVLSIPKTGDVSVVAYAVMAVVAAAGTMLKK